MNTVLIFIPSCLRQEESCKLVGLTHRCAQKSVDTFYILNSPQNSENLRSGEGLRNIGQYRKDCQYPKISDMDIHRNMVFLGMKSNEFVLHKLVSEGEDVNLFLSRKAILIVYDYELFLQSELLLSGHTNCDLNEYGNYFESLISGIKYGPTRMWKEKKDANNSTQGANCVIRSFVYLSSSILFLLSTLLPILKYSSLCLHVYNSLECFSWSLKTIASKRRITLKVGNYIVASVVDVLLGMIVLHWLMTLVSSNLPSLFLLNTAEVVVVTLQELLKWLMGIPAGLKLNFAFNNMLGKFFLYHINLWWTFLVLAKPILDFIIKIFLCFGRLGLTYQAAILGDLLALASFHVYCIYVYAARLYNLQVSGLLSLWRLFLGRKYNPLRSRVDSCQYSANQLFIGMLAFTILLFLLPTTIMYYSVFTTLRLLVAALAGLLTRVQLLLQMLPLYVTYLWFSRSPLISTSLHLQVKKTIPGEHLVLSAEPAPGSWCAVVQSCVPKPVKSLPKVYLGTLLKHVATGQLIYPM